VQCDLPAGGSQSQPPSRNLCPQTTEKEIMTKMKGGVAVESAEEEVLYKIDIPANRYDMLCVEGIARALNIFRGTMATPTYKLADMTGEQAGRRAACARAMPRGACMHGAGLA
jgi:hypothetical protein